MNVIAWLEFELTLMLQSSMLATTPLWFVGIKKKMNSNEGVSQEASDRKRNPGIPGGMDFLAPRGNSFSKSSDHFNWKYQFSAGGGGGGGEEHLFAELLTLPPVLNLMTWNLKLQMYISPKMTQIYFNALSGKRDCLFWYRKMFYITE